MIHLPSCTPCSPVLTCAFLTCTPPSPAFHPQDLRGCNQLKSLALACPALRAIDATFCSTLRWAAALGIPRCSVWPPWLQSQRLLTQAARGCFAAAGAHVGHELCEEVEVYSPILVTNSRSSLLHAPQLRLLPLPAPVQRRRHRGHCAVRRPAGAGAGGVQLG